MKRSEMLKIIYDASCKSASYHDDGVAELYCDDQAAAYFKDQE